MKKIMFAVKEKQSYIKCWESGPGTSWFPILKPNKTPPLVVPLDPGGTITLEFDEKQHAVSGPGDDIYFTGDQFLKDPSNNITGNLQQFHFRFYNLSAIYDPNTGSISNGSVHFIVMAMPDLGGAGADYCNVVASSKFLDSNSPTFDLGNGLGCGGCLVLDLNYTESNSNRHIFDMHMEAAVSMEDLDGDGKFEVMCPFPAGVPVVVGDYKESVSCMFGVIYGGGGIGVLPNGRVIRIPPRGASDRIFVPITEGLAELARGLALRDIVRDSSDVQSREAISRLSLEEVEKGLEGMLQAVRKERAFPSE